MAAPASGNGQHLMTGGGPLASAQQMVDVLPSASYVCSADGVVVAYNRRAAELWGRSPRPGDPAVRFCGSWRMYRTDGRALPHGECPMADALRSGSAVRDGEVVLERPDGSRILALVNINPLAGAAGSVAGAINTFSDITGRETRPPALTEPPPAFDLLQMLPVAVHVTDAAGRLTSYNDAAAALWGRRPPLGMPHWCRSWRLFGADGSPVSLDDCPLAPRQGEDRSSAELVLERPDGSRVPFLAEAVAIRDEGGAVVGAVTTQIDISGRPSGAVVARRLAAIVESTDDAIISLDLGGTIASWNRGAEGLYGYAAAEMIGQHVSRLVPADRQGEEQAILDRVRRGERVPSYETVRRRKDGSMVDIALTASPVTGAAGQVVGASKIARDISERRRTQERQLLLLRELNHRVKNLFAVARSVVALSSRHARTPKDLALAVQDRLAALSRAHQLTLPDFSETGELIVRHTDLAELIRTILTPYLPSDGRDMQRIRIDGPAQSISGTALTSLAMLVHEWATNAAKHGALSCSVGRLEIAWRQDGGDLVLTWEEHGGPAVLAGTPREGFGTLLARRTVEGQFGGHMTHEWRRGGLRLQLHVPLERLVQ